MIEDREGVGERDRGRRGGGGEETCRGVDKDEGGEEADCEGGGVG